VNTSKFSVQEDLIKHSQIDKMLRNVGTELSFYAYSYSVLFDEYSTLLVKFEILIQVNIEFTVFLNVIFQADKVNSENHGASTLTF
jgi:hypothetical protein